MRFTTRIIESEQQNLWLWIPVFFGAGVVFYFLNSENFLAQKNFLLALFCFCALLFYLNRNSFRSLIFIACATFLLGGFYGIFYENIFLNQTKISGKIYVDVVGKVESVKKFYNPVNQLEGANLVISELAMYKPKFEVKKKKEKKVKKKKTAKKKQKKPSTLSSSRKRQYKTTSSDLAETLDPRLRGDDTEKFIKQRKKIEKDFVNLPGYADIDRKFLDFSKNNYQQIKWLEANGHEVFPNPPQKISVNVVKNFSAISVNDKIAFRALLQPPNRKEFADDFDYEINAKMKKIGAYGFAIGEAHILENTAISSFESYFLNLREKIRTRISQNLNGDEKEIALAFLIGDQNGISKEMMQKIRFSGLAHLLSISGFHLSLAGAIFFVSSRFLLSRSQYLALNFDLKKIAAFLAIFGAYFYLKIASSPIPAQRAFLMILFIFLALVFSEKINSRRAIIACALFLILYNPYIIFSISFQLSFIAVLTLGVFHDEIKLDFLPKILRYFCAMILLSIFIQITTAPILMHSFRNLAPLGFAANLAAIPLTSFIIMPLGFLALFLMPFQLEHFALLGMNEGILLLEKIINFIASFDFSKSLSPHLPSSGLVIAVIGILWFLLLQSRARFFGIAIFCAAFLTIFFTQKPILIFEKEQKFFVLYNQEGLFFSKDLKPSKQRQKWLDRFDEKDFKTLKSCGEKTCELKVEGKKILVVLKREKISKLCKNNYDLAINMTAKYEMPRCAKAKVVIDNLDFFERGTIEIFKEVAAPRVARLRAKSGDPNEIRTRISTVKGWHPNH